ncbi:MAG: hypothetical protein KF763_16520 [Cyclobacteriaceae bacterium]|nr:hypothetical protein [Cyclobacteriaceae bacterium]
MKTKLTLSIDSKILAKAKRGAKKEKIALSKLVKTYFDKKYQQLVDKPTPIADSLRGILKGKVPDLPYKELRDRMYKDKYGL